MIATSYSNIVVHLRGDHCIARDEFEGTVLFEGSPSKVLTTVIGAAPVTGASVRLAAGDYYLDAPIQLKSRVSLHGSGRASRLIVALPPEVPAIQLFGVNEAEVRNFSLLTKERHTCGDGIVVKDAGDCVVADIHCSGFGGSGIVLRANSFLCRIESCSSSDNLHANFHTIELHRNGRGGDFVPNLILGCISYGGGVGFDVERSLVLNLVACIVHQPNRHGFHVHRRSNSVLISGCRTFQVGGHALLVEDSHELNASSNVFCWTREDNVVLRDVAWAVLGCNEFIDAGVRAPDAALRDGLRLEGECRGVQVTGNAIFNWGDQPPMKTGIIETPSGRNNGFLGNNLNYCMDGAWRLEGTGSTANHNIACGKSSYVAQGQSPCPDFDAQQLNLFIRSVQR